MMIIILIVIVLIIYGRKMKKEAARSNEQADIIISKAKNRYFNAKDNLEKQQKLTSVIINLLGKQCTNVWSHEISNFVEVSSCFTRSSQKIISEKYRISTMKNENNLSINQVKRISLKASNQMEAGLVGVGSGALACVALYGGVAAFGSSSTGIAIAGLGGAAKANATLAFLGGGAKSIGGLGIIGGKAVLGGVFIGVSYAAYSKYSNIQATNNLVEAEKLSLEVTKEVEKLMKLENFLKELESVLLLYRDTLSLMTSVYDDILEEFKQILMEQSIKQEKLLLNRIRNLFKMPIKVDYTKISELDMIKLDSGYIVTMILNDLLNTPVLTSNGEINVNTLRILSDTKDVIDEYVDTRLVGSYI